jgi:hypothetical protein
MLGSWSTKPGTTPQAILGPLAAEFISFTAQRDNKTSDVWFTVLPGQVFRVSGDQMQYCFGPYGFLVEQSPFSVNATSEKAVSFCWREGLIGMPTQAKGCRGCDCASITITLVDDNTLRFQFWMRMPIVHADATFVRTGHAPKMSKITSTMKLPYMQCTMKDHYGPNLPGEPDLKPNKTSCSGAAATVALEKMKDSDADFGQLVSSLQEQSSKKKGLCRQLNGMNLLLDGVSKQKTGVRDIRIQYVKPTSPCDPCDVTYSVSAKTSEDEYIAVGFKGQSWEHKFPYPPANISRPCYFGMCVDSYDNYTSDRIALGYTSGNGGCVREMIVKQNPSAVGAPIDVDYKIMKNTTVERSNGRTIVRFTVPQHWPKADGFPKTIMPDGEWRIMWAIGKVTQPQNGCSAELSYHGVDRGVSPLYWLDLLYFGQSPGSLPCMGGFNEYEYSGTHPYLVV